MIFSKLHKLYFLKSPLQRNVFYVITNTVVCTKLLFNFSEYYNFACIEMFETVKIKRSESAYVRENFENLSLGRMINI